ncbi:MAG: hypothetical protein GY856_22690 [bacterium]|nr:hypothetical protein [bacterium]
MTGDRTLDLVVLVPGADEREALDELLSVRHASLGIRRVRYRLVKHSQRDPGCFHTGPQLLQPYQRLAEHALIVFDHEGSGQEGRNPQEVAEDLRHRMSLTGWGERAEVVVIHPELEVWIWSDSPQVDQVLGWKRRRLDLRPWMVEHGLWPEEALKPPRPKESLERALREVSLRRSAALYRELAASVGLERCRDASFRQFRAILRSWFP